MKRRAIEFAILLMVALGAGPVGAAIWSWSTTAGSNATADPSINWSEGMSPSSVNDSARAMMAVIAAWRSDISGVNTTAGTSTAYTLTTLEGVNTTPSNGQMISFIPNATNGVAPTLTVDGGNTYPIWLNGAAVGAASLIAGTPYRVSFSTGSSAWLLESGYGNPYSVPLGGLLDSTVSTPPNSNFILPAGQCISTTTYNAYWVALGSPASGACGGGQFAVIDMRGRMAAALDNLNGTPANRLTSASTGCGTAMTSMGASCANGAESHTLTAAEIAPHTHPAISTDSGHTHPVAAAYGDATAGRTNGIISAGTGAGFIASNTLSGTANITTTVSNNTGGNAHPIVPPVIGIYKFLRVI